MFDKVNVLCKVVYIYPKFLSFRFSGFLFFGFFLICEFIVGHLGPPPVGSGIRPPGHTAMAFCFLAFVNGLLLILCCIEGRFRAQSEH
jgi:hypothetical protein